MRRCRQRKRTNQRFFGSVFVAADTSPCRALFTDTGIPVFTGVTLYTPIAPPELGWRVPVSYSATARARVRTEHVACTCHTRDFCCFRSHLSTSGVRTTQDHETAIVARVVFFIFYFLTCCGRTITAFVVTFFFRCYLLCSQNNSRFKNLLCVVCAAELRFAVEGSKVTGLLTV